VAAKVVDLQVVILFQVLQNAVDPLDAESSPLLANQNRRFDANWLNMGETILDVLL
jgi:hypothetical protein